MKKFIVGFFTARHNDIDGVSFGDCNVVLEKMIIEAVDVAQAQLFAQQKVDLEELQKEVTRRWPSSKFVGITAQNIYKTSGNFRGTRTWMRSFRSISFKAIAKIQKNELSIGEQVVLGRGA